MQKRVDVNHSFSILEKSKKKEHSFIYSIMILWNLTAIRKESILKQRAWCMGVL